MRDPVAAHPRGGLLPKLGDGDAISGEVARPVGDLLSETEAPSGIRRAVGVATMTPAWC